MNERLEGWERRLFVIVEDARRRPYALGEHDCFRLACRVVEALTGIDRWPEFAGYTTRAEALRMLARHGRSFEEAGDWFFGSPRIEARLARRGDICAFRDDTTGEKHLGVCTGNAVMMLGERGTLWVEPAACLCAWKVG